MGGLPLTGAYGPSTDADAIRLIQHGLDRGVTLIDTANVYRSGRNEALVGRAVRRRRDEIKIATKVGLRMRRPGVSSSPAQIKSAVRASLRRLMVERIDLLFLHRVDPVVPLEESVGAMAELAHEGLVDQLGLSEVTAPEIRRAATVHPIAAIQSEWSLWSRDVERSVVHAAADAGIGFVASAPLGRGFLAGAVGDPEQGNERRRVPRLVGGARTANLAIAEAIAQAAFNLGVSRAQIALAWLRNAAARLTITVVPIPGTRSIEHLDDNLAALNVVLPVDIITQLDQLACKVVGARGARPEWLSVGREITDTRNLTAHLHDFNPS